MGFLDWFRGKGSDDKEDGRPQGDRTVLRLQKKLMNKYHNTIERKRVISLLANVGTEEAIRALLGRFTYVTDGSIVDEDEKEMTYGIILDKGRAAVPALTGFIQTEAAVYWPLKALTEIAGEEEACRVVIGTLGTITDRWGRSMERMTNLVSCLRDFKRPEVLQKLMALAHDESEEIRFLAVDGLSAFDDHSEAVDAIIERLLDEQETVRVKTFIMDLLLERKWKVKKYKKDLAGKLPESYFIDDTGIIQRR